jgi:hypothetical protein
MVSVYENCPARWKVLKKEADRWRIAQSVIYWVFIGRHVSQVTAREVDSHTPREEERFIY